MKKRLYWIFRNLLLICVFANTVSVLAQSKIGDLKTIWGPEEKGAYPNTSIAYEFIGKDASGIYVLKKSKFGQNENKYTELIHYSHDLRILNSKKIQLDNNKKVHEFFVFLDQQLRHFYFSRERDGDKYLLHTETFDKATLLPKGKGKVLGDVTVFAKREWYAMDMFQFQTSRDQSKVLIYSKFHTPIQGKKMFRLFVLDMKLNLLWDKEVTLPYDTKFFSVQNYKIDNNGDVYVAGRRFFKKSEIKIKNAPEYRNEVIAFSKSGTEMKIIPIEFEDKLLGQGKLLINNQQDVVYGGFYRSTKSEQYLGTYYLKISGEEKEIIKSISKEFSLDLITSGLTINEIKKAEKNKAIGKFIGEPIGGVDSLILREDGGVFIIGKRTLIPEYLEKPPIHGVNLNPDFRPTRDYYGLVVTSFDEKGGFEWEKKITQFQSSTEIGYIYFSPTLATINNSLFCIFNDHPENINYKEGRPKLYDGKKKSVVISVKINPNGTGFDERKVLLTGGQNMDNYKLMPTSSEHLGENKMILFTKQKKLNKVAIIVLD